MRLRVWHCRDYGSPPFLQDVPDARTGAEVLRALANYECYLEDRCDDSYAITQGMDIFNQKTHKWEKYLDEEGRDIKEIAKSFDLS